MDSSESLISLGKKLFAQGYYKVGHQKVAKLPDGKTGLEALNEASRRHPFVIHARLGEWYVEAKAGDYYLRNYAEAIDLSPTVMEAFEKAGGETYYKYAHRTEWMLRQKNAGPKK